MKKSKWSRTTALLTACVMALGMAACSSKSETTTGKSGDEPFWPEEESAEGTTKKNESKKSGDPSEDDSFWGAGFEEGDDRAGHSFEESREEGDSKAGQSFEESREGYDRAPDEIFWEQGDGQWVADDSTLRIVDGAFFMDESILGMPYDFANEFFGGLPLLDAWEWDNRYTGKCDISYNGHWYNLFFSGENLAAVRYEIEGDDVEKFLDTYMASFGGYGYRTDPNTGADIDHGKNGYGYAFNTNGSTFVLFLNEYDGKPHIAMQYEYATKNVNTLAPEDIGNDTAPTTKVTAQTAKDSATTEPSNIADDTTLYVVNNEFFMDTFYLGCEYSYIDGLFEGNLPLLDAFEWDPRFDGCCDYYFNGHWYTFFFTGTYLSAVRYEFEGDDLERYLDTYSSYYGDFEYRRDPSTNTVIDVGGEGYGYTFKTGEGSFVIFLNVYDGVPHVAMQYEVWD